MKEKKFILSILSIFLTVASSAAARSFDTSATSDIKLQSQRELSITTPAPAAQEQTTIHGPSRIPQVQKTQTFSSQNAATPVMPQAPLLPTSGSSRQINIPQMQQVKISVPDYEEQFRKLFEAKEAAKKAKKKNIIEKILDELVRYGMHIGLALVIIILFYALRKDKDTPGTGLRLPARPQIKSGKTSKPDIWHEDF